MAKHRVYKLSRRKIAVGNVSIAMLSVVLAFLISNFFGIIMLLYRIANLRRLANAKSAEEIARLSYTEEIIWMTICFVACFVSPPIALPIMLCRAVRVALSIRESR